MQGQPRLEFALNGDHLLIKSHRILTTADQAKTGFWSRVAFTTVDNFKTSPLDSFVLRAPALSVARHAPWARDSAPKKLESLPHIIFAPDDAFNVRFLAGT